MTRTLASEALKAGLIAGLLDISAAFIQYYSRTGRNPLAVLKFIASGAFGRRALTGGSDMIVWGLVFHFLLALAFAGLFFWMAARLPLLRKAWVGAGIAYGLAVWIVMNGAVVPLSRTPELPLDWPGALIGISILIACIGLPIAYLAKRAEGFNTTSHPAARSTH